MTTFHVIALSVLSVALTAETDAQTAIGYHVGGAWSGMASASTVGYSSRLVPAAGVAFEVPITRYLSLMPEAAYHVRGARESLNFLARRYGLIWKFNYIDLNAIAIVRVGQNPVRPHFLIGPSFGLLNSAWLLHLHDNEVIERESLDAERMKLGRTQFSLVAGAGFTFRVGGHRLMVDGRYAHGFTDLMGAATVTDSYGVVVRQLSGYERTYSLDLVYLLTIPEAHRPK
ncbi:MAG: PorT family protein [Flavobacteriales bacterium]|jgi:hypothetical protein|nr:PorT family protein [Flavobacteriales bacterium]